MSGESYQVRRYVVPPGVDGIKVMSPIECNSISIRNEGSRMTLIVTDPAVANAWDDLRPGSTIVIAGSRTIFQIIGPSQFVPTPHRFIKSGFVCILKQPEGESASGDIRVGFVI